MAEVFERDPLLYLEDGDFVITATRATDTVVQVFRVDKVFLTRQSGIFREVLSLPAGDTDKYEGVPRMHLPDDAANVRGLIQAMYDQS